MRRAWGRRWPTSPGTRPASRGRACPRSSAICRRRRGRWSSTNWERAGAPVIETKTTARGDFRATNDRLAGVALEALTAGGFTRIGDAAREAARAAALPGRYERMPSNGGPTVILDGAHNPDKARALAALWRARIGGRRRRARGRNNWLSITGRCPGAAVADGRDVGRHRAPGAGETGHARRGQRPRRQRRRGTARRRRARPSASAGPRPGHLSPKRERARRGVVVPGGQPPVTVVSHGRHRTAAHHVAAAPYCPRR